MTLHHIRLCAACLLPFVSLVGQPFNDDFAFRESLEPGTTQVSGDNYSATREIDEPVNPSAAGDATVWWQVNTGGTPGQMTVDTFGSNFDTVLAVYESSDPESTDLYELILLDANDDAAETAQSSVSFTVEAWSSYFVQVAGYSSSEGSITLNITAPDPLVTIPDSSLLGVVESALEKSPGEPISQSELAGLTSLTAINDGITDLSGLEHATGLLDLNLLLNEISDLGPLAGLTQLQNLELGYNQITDISDLSGLTSLQSLGLSGNAVGDVSAVSGLTNLQSLYLDQMGLDDADLAGLASLTSLTLLSAYGNAFTDLSPLSGLSLLEDLNLSENRISDLSPLSGLTALVRLVFYTNQISDLTPLAALVNMDELYLQANPVSDLSPLAGMTSLRILQLGGSYLIHDISVLANFPGLEDLWIFNELVDDLTIISSLANLQELWVYGNQITDITPVDDLLNLQTLYLQNNHLDIEPGSDAWIILDALSVFADVVYSPQKSSMRSLASWAGEVGLTAGNNGPLDENGPLSVPNVLAFGMGLDPSAITSADLPAKGTADPVNNTISFIYNRDLHAVGVRLAVEVTDDLQTWVPTRPVQLNILSSDGDGRQRVEAVFDRYNGNLHFRLDAEAF